MAEWSRPLCLRFKKENTLAASDLKQQSIVFLRWKKQNFQIHFHEVLAGHGQTGTCVIHTVHPAGLVQHRGTVVACPALQNLLFFALFAINNI